MIHRWSGKVERESERATQFQQIALFSSWRIRILKGVQGQITKSPAPLLIEWPSLYCRSILTDIIFILSPRTKASSSDEFLITRKRLRMGAASQPAAAQNNNNNNHYIYLTLIRIVWGHSSGNGKGVILNGMDCVYGQINICIKTRTYGYSICVPASAPHTTHGTQIPTFDLKQEYAQTHTSWH